MEQETLEPAVVPDRGARQHIDALRAVVALNLWAQLPQVESHAAHGRTCCIVGNTYVEDDIRALYDAGVDIVTMGRTTGARITASGVTPWGHVIVGPELSEAVERPRDSCRYYLASQVHPDVTADLRNCPNVYQFHLDDPLTRDLISHWFFGAVYIMPRGTPESRARVLMRLLGYCGTIPVFN